MSYLGKDVDQDLNRVKSATKRKLNGRAWANNVYGHRTMMHVMYSRVHASLEVEGNRIGLALHDKLWRSQYDKKGRRRA
jgi:hypothetical protein